MPAWIPGGYRLHQSTVDVEGYVALYTNRYSVPVDGIGRRVEVRETKDKIEIQLDARHGVAYARAAEAEHQRVTRAEHRPPRGQGIPRRPDLHPEEKGFLAAVPKMAGYVMIALLDQLEEDVTPFGCEVDIPQLVDQHDG